MPDSRALALPEYITRILPQWRTPNWASASQWRYLVRNQPAAIITRGTLTDNILSTEWYVTARDETQKAGLKKEIQRHEDIIRDFNGDGYDIGMELVLEDALDIPFGGMVEIVREEDRPDAPIAWVAHVDGATLAPTFRPDFPVLQRIPERPAEQAMFPPHAISRMYYTPRPEIQRKGWGMAPPEKIYLAIELLRRGDQYYANMLLDTPEAGVLDLLDMSEKSAQNWLAGWRELLQGIDPFKIPVLHSHTTPAKFISFTRPPMEMLFDKTIVQYTAFVAAGYGLSLSDIGEVRGSPNTLAGTIRQERRSTKTGFGVLKRKTVAFWNRILPPALEYKFVDRDEELLVSKGRARLASSMALKNLVDTGIINVETAADQLVDDGLISVPLRLGEPGGDGVFIEQLPRQLVGETPVPASKGGEGEVSARAFIPEVDDIKARRLAKLATRNLFSFIRNGVLALDDDNVKPWRNDVLACVLGERSESEKLELVAKLLNKHWESVRNDLQGQSWWKVSLTTDRANQFLRDNVVQRAVIKKYEDGLRDSVDYEDIRLDGVGERFLNDVDSSTVFLLSRAAARAVLLALTKQENTDMIREGVGVDDFVNSWRYMNDVVTKFRAFLSVAWEARLKAIEEQYTKVIEEVI